jgi:hypothetical protein
MFWVRSLVRDGTTVTRLSRLGRMRFFDAILEPTFPLFEKLEPTPLDRRRMDRIAKSGLPEGWLDDLGQRQVLLRGRGGVGKTVILLQMAYRAFDHHLRRTPIITKSGSHRTPRWREADSNPRSLWPVVMNERRTELGEMRRGDFGGCLSAADLPEPTVHQGDDFLLNLRIVQQTQERLFERLVLLCVLDLIFSFGSIFHCASMPQGSSAECPSFCNAANQRWKASGGLVH